MAKMVFGKSLKDSRRFSLSEWDNAAIETPHSEMGHDTARQSGPPNGNSGSDSGSSSGSTPEMNLSSIYNTIEGNRKQESCGIEDSFRESLQVACGDGHGGHSDGHHSHHPNAKVGGKPNTRMGRRRSSLNLFQKFKSQQSMSHCGQFDDGSTIAPSSSAGRTTSYSSGGGTNIWSKLITNYNEGVWDGLTGKEAFGDDVDGMDGMDDTDSLDDCDPLHPPTCLQSTRKAMKLTCLCWWYETRHFLSTLLQNPHIPLLSLCVTFLFLGVSFVAIDSQRNSYIKKQQMTVTFIAQETGEWFANEFRKAMLPLYGVQQAVMHSGYFEELARQIGDYPLHVIQETDYIADPSLEDVPKGRIFRNVTGICDTPELHQKWLDIIEPINHDNGLDDGSVFSYRLAPRATFCLVHNDHNENDVSAKDGNFGFDTSVSYRSGFWKQVTRDVFGIGASTTTNPADSADPADAPLSMPGLGTGQVYSIFGPFGMPEKEWFCGHLPVYSRPSENILNPLPPLNIHGVQVENGWGFVMNYIDWRNVKDRSNIYDRFQDCNVEFELTRKDDGVELASSPNAHLLTEENSITVETPSLHGVWVNKVGSLNGWSPPWYPPALALVIVGSLLLGFLTASTLVERQLHRNLVQKMLPRKAILKLHRGQTVMEHYNLVTIFFSDIVGFTSMAGSMRPIQVMKMLNELYTEFDKLVQKHGVYKVETIGDAYMVVGGAPERVSAPLAAERVALFAMDAINFVKGWRSQDGFQVFVRAGLASGPTVAGVVGKAMPRYCFFGDTVNFASRMESTSKKMRVQVADITHRLLMDAPNMDFKLTKRMEGDVAGVQVKGKGHVITYWVEKATPRENVKTTATTEYALETVHEVEDDEEGRTASISHSISHSSSGQSEDSESKDIGMYTPDEIYAAMSAQEWHSLGHAENVMVAATDDVETMIVRASALLEHHLTRVLQSRDANQKSLPLGVKVQIRKFVSDIAATYSSVHFHNLSHALHVTTNMNKLLSESIGEDPLNSFSLVFAAFVHDAGHTGMSNKILRDTHHPLSDKYEESVPLAERESISIALNLLFRPEYESLRLAILPDVLDKIQFAKTLFQSILVTDIATPEMVRLGVKRYDVSQDVQGSYDAALCPLVEYLDDVLVGVGLEESDKENHREEFIITHTGLGKCVRNEHLMLVSDVGHLMQGWSNFIKWNFRLYKELNECHKRGQCPDPRDGWFQGQIGFLDKYITPLARRSKIYFNEGFGNELVKITASLFSLWLQHGVRATEIIVSSVDNGEEESATLLRLYDLPSQ